jgi:hypothetical protein
MAVKIIQNVNKISANPGVAATSNPIALKSGYLRVSIASSGVGCYVVVGNDPVATTNDFHVGTYTAEVLKERLARQKIAGITTGTTTTLIFENNAGNPFLSTDYVSIEGAPTAGINTTHKSIVSLTDSSVTINFNSSSIVSPNITGADLVRSVKVSAYTPDTNLGVSVTEVVQLVSE